MQVTGRKQNYIIYKKEGIPMNKEVQDYVVEKTKELMAAHSCSQEAKDAARAWLDALGTPKEEEETGKYMAELKEDLVTIDGLIGFAGSEMGGQVFGAEKAKEIKAHAEEIKAAGAKYCDCPACQAVEAILDKMGLL